MSLLLETMTASIASAGRLAVLWSALTAELAFAAQTNVQNPSDLQLNPTPSVGKGIPKTYAQDLVERTAAKHPELASLQIEAKPPDDLDSLVIASTDPDRVRKKSSSEAIRVFETGMPHVEINVTGQEATVAARLQDVTRRPIGTVTVTLRNAQGTEANALIDKARKVAEEMRQQIPSLERLVEPVQLTSDEEEEEEEEEAEESLPMTKAVVKGAALEDTKQEGYSEAIKNVAGVSPANSKGTANDSVNIRGIKLNLFSNYRLNGGLSTAGVLTVPTENKEKIETLKGANALMFGIASPAGIINLITKRAGPVDFTSVGWLANSFGQLGGSVDIGRRLLPNKQLGVRLNASVAQLENGVRGTRGDGEFGSLGLDWRATSRLTLQADVEYFVKHVGEQAGVNLLPVIDGRIAITKVPNPRNLLSGPWNKLRADTKNFQVRGDYVLFDGLKVLAEVGRSYAYRSRFTTRISGYDPDTGAGGQVRVNTVHQVYLNTFERVELLGKFSTWFLTHHLTVGASRSGRKADTPYQNNTTFPDTLRQNIFNPIELPAPIFTLPPNPLPNQISTETGVYAYDTITIIPQVRLLGGLRVTWDREETRQAVPAKTTRVWTPAFGALWDVLPNLTVFGSYMEGLEAGATAPVNAVNAYAILPPAVSTQKEVGVRYSTLRGLAVSASAFQITRANAVTDPSTMIFAENGSIDYKGIEATLTLEVARPLTIGAAGQWLRAIQSSPDRTVNTINDKHPENTPSALGNVWISIRPPWIPGLTLNAGASAIAKRFINPQDQGTIPGYTLFTAGVGYQMRSGTTRAVFLVNVDNLANIRYWNSVQTGTYGTGMDRSIKMSARVDF
jgi:iron complex outermembrane receptor protein